MSDVVICEPLRTPVGAFGGSLKDVPAQDLASTVIAELLARTGIPGDRVDEVVLGHCYPTMEAPAIGRVAALDAGLPVEVTGLQLDRRCGSGLQAVIYAAQQVRTGAARLVLAGGAESMSSAPFYSLSARWGASRGGPITFADALTRGRVTAGGRRHPMPGGMLETAENLRRSHGIGREEQDAYAVRSHHRAHAAQEAGVFDAEIVPVPVSGRNGTTWVRLDEHVRADSSMDAMAGLRPILGGTDPEATVTAGNASGQNDGAAICVVTTRGTAEELGLRPSARLVAHAIAGTDPARMGLGPVPAVVRLLDRAGLDWPDIDVIELNEAFAVQVLACAREWGLGAGDFDRINVHGSGIALGHPVGATGGRILATLLREMERRGARFGLETMCIGGGQGIAALFEAV